MAVRSIASAPPRVLIIGGGFGGLQAAKVLSREKVAVTLLDRRNHHLFQPLLYQVATAALNPSDIATPIRCVFGRRGNVEVLMGKVTAIDLKRRRAITADGEFAYDYLIVAAGATHSYFGHDEWEEAAPGLKTVEDATEIRRRILVAYEAAERDRDPARRREWLTFVVVGGGPTGVETAGALAEISRRVMERDFRRIDPRDARIILVEAADRLLPAMSPESSLSARRQLERIGAEVRTGASVTGIDDSGVELGPERIPARTVIWAAGVAASALGRALGVAVDRAGRVLVNPDLTIPGAPEVFVIGDLASLKCDGKPVPGLSPAAMQEGRHAARNILRAIAGRPHEPFKYFDKGSIATIGRAAAVADIGRLRLSGTIAWLAWIFVHIFYLISFRNRFLVMTQWAWVYLRFVRGARLITGDSERLFHRGDRKPAPAMQPQGSAAQTAPHPGQT